MAIKGLKYGLYVLKDGCTIVAVVQVWRNQSNNDKSLSNGIQRQRRRRKSPPMSVILGMHIEQSVVWV